MLIAATTVVLSNNQKLLQSTNKSMTATSQSLSNTMIVETSGGGELRLIPRIRQDIGNDLQKYYEQPQGAITLTREETLALHTFLSCVLSPPK